MPAPSFARNLAFMRKQKRTEAKIVVQPKPPTLAQVDAWKAANDAGTYKALVGSDGRIEQIMWDSKFDHNRFMAWVSSKKPKGRV